MENYANLKERDIHSLTHGVSVINEYIIISSGVLIQN
jgi:hypothetical protein